MIDRAKLSLEEDGHNQLTFLDYATSKFIAKSNFESVTSMVSGGYFSYDGVFSYFS